MPARPTLNDAFSRKKNSPLFHLMVCCRMNHGDCLKEYREANVKIQTFGNGTKVPEEHSALFLAAFQSSYTAMSRVSQKLTFCTYFTTFFPLSL